MTLSPENGGTIIHDLRIVARVARMCFDLGADILKVAYTGTTASFKEVIAACPVPVTIMGGPRMDSDRAVLEAVKDSIDAGSAGITMGRNVWKAPNVLGMIRALTKIIHHNASVSEAIQETE
jgi:class I fructose-bisphosphate aldolase